MKRVLKPYPTIAIVKLIITGKSLYDKMGWDVHDLNMDNHCPCILFTLKTIH